MDIYEVWHRAEEVPPAPGVYEIDESGSNDWYAYWNGERFGYRCCNGPDEAYRLRDQYTGCAERACWRYVKGFSAPFSPPIPAPAVYDPSKPSVYKWRIRNNLRST